MSTAQTADETTRRPDGCDCSGVKLAGDPLACFECWLQGFDSPNPEVGD